MNQIPVSKQTGHQACSKTEQNVLKHIGISLHSVVMNIRISAVTWFIVHGDKSLMREGEENVDALL